MSAFCCQNFETLYILYLLQETNEIVAIKKFKDSEGKKWPVSRKKHVLYVVPVRG